MTGLDIETDHLIEIACLVTDGNLNMVAEVTYFFLISQTCQKDI